MPARPRLGGGRADRDDGSPPPSYFSSLRNKASQFSLRSIHRDSFTGTGTASSSLLPTPVSSRPATPVHVGGSNAGPSSYEHDSEPLPPTEQTRLFGLSRWASKARRSTTSSGKQPGPAYGAIRLEDTVVDGVNGGDDAAFGLSVSGSDSEAQPAGRVQRVRRWFDRRPLVRAGLQMAAIFLLSTLFMGGTLRLALPKLEK